MADSPERSAEPQRNQRRASRFRYFGVIFLSWIEPGGENFVMGKCLDISVSGLGVQVARRISINTEVRVRADWMTLDGAAIVRHVQERGGVFQIGLQMQQPLRPETLEQLVGLGPEIREP
jgi:hypothetical protein